MSVKNTIMAAAGIGGDKLYVEDVFSTYLYTGNGSTQTITNGIDLAGEGGLVWLKARSQASTPNFTDTLRGANNLLYPNLTNAQATGTWGVNTFNSNGFGITGADGANNGSGTTYASWTFRKAPKFFDVVTWTGDGTGDRWISHSLASVPGCIIMRPLPIASNWAVWHRSTGTDGLFLNLTEAAAGYVFSQKLNQSTSSAFLVDGAGYNVSGRTYVAYLFAHDTGGFGDDGEQNVISCGSYTGNGSLQTITLGYEPQWLLIKNATTGATNWSMIDCIRSSRLIPNLSDTEDNIGYAFSYDTGDGTLRGAPTATGFQVGGGDSPGDSDYNASGDTYIYIAIRRSMKTPTMGTSVFTPVAYTGTNVDNRLVNTGIVTDMALARIRTATSVGGFYNASRMVRGGNLFLETATTAAINGDADSFMTPTLGAGTSFAAMNGFGVGNDATRQLNQSSTSQLAYAFQRAPGFFDEVCYTGTGSARTVEHNLGVAPELMIVKRRSGVADWGVYAQPIGATKRLLLNDTSGSVTDDLWNNTTPTASVFSLFTNPEVNTSGSTYVAYLFASCPGVSKCFSYTGNGSSQTINCGFTGGARFVMIKRTDSTGDWYVWDSARGIVSGNDPHLSLNTTAAEVTTDDSVDTDSTGFVVNQLSATNINVSSATYIGIAIA